MILWYRLDKWSRMRCPLLFNQDGSVNREHYSHNDISRLPFECPIWQRARSVPGIIDTSKNYKFSIDFVFCLCVLVVNLLKVVCMRWAYSMPLRKITQPWGRGPCSSRSPPHLRSTTKHFHNTNQKIQSQNQLPYIIHVYLCNDVTQINGKHAVTISTNILEVHSQNSHPTTCIKSSRYPTKFLTHMLFKF